MFVFLLMPQIAFLMLVECSYAVNDAYLKTWDSLLDDTSQKYLDPEKRILNIDYPKRRRTPVWHSELASVVTLRERVA